MSANIMGTTKLIAAHGWRAANDTQERGSRASSRTRRFRSMMQQKDFETRIAREIATDTPGEWLRVQYTVNSLTHYYEELCHVKDSDGNWQTSLPPAGLHDPVSELRSVTYRDGAGTWFSMTLTLAKQDGRTRMHVGYDYDQIPDWDTTPASNLYLLDLIEFPRTPEHVPGWLAERIEHAEANYPREYAEYEHAMRRRGQPHE